MKRIDILLHRARRLDGAMFPTVNVLSFMGGMYRLEIGLWDGKGKTDKRVSEHSTKQAALDAFDSFLEKYGEARRDAAVLIDMTDVMEGGGANGETSVAPVDPC